MKTILTLAFLIQTSIVLAGPSVSGGIIYHENFEACANKSVPSSLRISAVMYPGNYIGYMTIDKNTTILKCEKGDNRRGLISDEELVFLCEEKRAGGGQLQVYVNRNNFGLKYAAVYRADILNRPYKLFFMACDQQVSN